MDVDLFAQQSELIESVLAASCRLHRLVPTEAEEFCSWARLRLLDRDRAILRKFGHRSSWRTFLVTVVERLYLDWRNHEWGKWRPSSEARRLGDLAIELERLVLRDHLAFSEAAHTLIGRGVAASWLECETTWARLPRQPRRQRVDEEVLAGMAGPDPVRDPVSDQQERERARRLTEALEQAIARLPPPDQAIVRMRYWSGLRVPRIAEVVRLDQKFLYRRLSRIVADLRLAMEAAGFGGRLGGLFDVFDPDEPEEPDDANGE